MKLKLAHFSILWFIIKILSASANLDIIDKTNEKIVKFHLGDARLRNGFFHIIHRTNLENLKLLTNRIEATAEKCLAGQHIILSIITTKCKELNSKLRLLSPTIRRKRSISWIGSALKWIAGNPDEHDLAVITDQMNNMAENNNKQTIINQNFQDSINRLIDKYQSWKNDQQEGRETEIFLLEELRQAQRTADNLFASIHLAKGNLINQGSIDDATMKQVSDWAKRNRFANLSPTENLDFAKISIATTTDSIISIMKLPTVTNETYDYSIIRPVSSRRLSVNTNVDQVIIGKTTIFAVKKGCERTNGIFICEQNNLRNISDDTCIPNILQLKNATCSFHESYKRNTIEEITEGVLFLDNFNGTIKSSCIHPRTVSGAFVIKVQNCTAKIGDFIYQNHIEPEIRVDDSKYHQNPELKKVDHILSMEYLEHLHINNTNHIRKIETNHLWLSTSHISFTLLSLSGLLGYVLWTKQKTTKINNTTAGSNGPNTQAEAPAETNPMPDPGTASFSYKQRGRALQ